MPVPESDSGQNAWARLRCALEELGPVFIKFGQLLSTRRDLLPDEAMGELQKLQDQVPPFPDAEAIAAIETALGQPVERLFARFDRTPLAAASVAQVYTARLHEGDEVVVKVLRPEIEPIVQRDLALLLTGARILERCFPPVRRFHPVEVVTDYQHILLGELDLGQEAANAAQFRRNAEHSGLLYVPDIYWPYCRRNILVMERVYGVPVSAIETMQAAGVDLQELAEVGVEIFFTQVFRDNFFHADMHPGNVMVDIRDPARPRYLSLDCAIAGSLSRSERFLLARQLMAVLDRDYEQIALLLVQAGWVPNTTPIQPFAQALRSVLEPVIEKPLHNIEFGPILMRLFQTARRFDMHALPQFVLLEKTLIHVEGLGRQLYPELDIWTVGRPLLEGWIRDQVGPGALMQLVKRHAPGLIEQAPQLPALAWEALSELKSFNQNQQRILHQHRMQLRQDRLRWLAGLGVIALACLWAIDPEWWPQWNAVPWQAWTLGVLGGVWLLRQGRMPFAGE
jgi:ubiquinone biosynthesis protein